MNIIGNILIRDIDDNVLLKLSDDAKRNHISREAYVRNILTVAANEDILYEQQNRYETMMKTVIEVMKEQGDVIERNTLLMQMLLEKDI